MRYEKSALRKIVEERFDAAIAEKRAEHEAALNYDEDAAREKYKRKALRWLTEQRKLVNNGGDLDTYNSPNAPSRSRYAYRNAQWLETQVANLEAAKKKALQRVDALMPDADGGVSLTLPQLDRLTLNGA